MMALSESALLHKPHAITSIDLRRIYAIKNYTIKSIDYMIFIYPALHCDRNSDR